MKKIFLIFIICILMCSCNKNNEARNDMYKIGYSSNLIDEKDRNELRKVFDEHKLSNVDLFFKWLDDFNKEEDMGCGLKNWDKTDTFIYNDANCMDRYEKIHSKSDGDCRIIAYALLQNIIEINTIESEYGTYLMFDMDVLENNEDYKTINDNQLDFINLFNEMDVSNIEKEEYKNVYPNNLKSHDFKLNSDKVSLISVVLHDSDFNTLFVGHAGVLINLDDKYLFVEKIAFEQPYQISVIKSKNDLIELFNNRSTYFGDESAKGPYIYENDKLLYEYE